MMALSLLAIALFLCATRYRIWIYAAASGMMFSMSLWSLMQFLMGILPAEWHGLSAFLAILCVYCVIYVMVSAYQKWQHYKHKRALM
ncbi:MAG: hypothetical protein H6996_09420 [Moraxellaceae bacterium]|nr:hypothetical protein [Moraxellaceae bacterium]MCP5177303.1 hypothetical protein [Moraxellaceae bacterium]HQV22578.1 hypothetical protein [Agitococcus sp.]